MRIQTAQLGVRAILAVVLAFGLPLLLLATLSFFQYRAERLSQGLTGFDRDVNVVDALRIDAGYNRWRSALDAFVTDPRPATYEAFAVADKIWQQELYTLAAAATEPKWAKVLETATQARTDVMKSVDALGQSAATLIDAEDATITRADSILKQLETVRDSLDLGKPDMALLTQDIAGRFHDGVIAALRYIRTGEDTLADQARQHFVGIEDNLNQLTSQNPNNRQVETLRKNLGEFYDAFEQIATTAKAQKSAQTTLTSATMKDHLQKVNPVASTDWTRAMGSIQSGSLGQTFTIMQIVTVIGIVLLLGGMVYALAQLHLGFQKPLQALLSYCNHAWLTRRRSPVPGTDRPDELGQLARAIQSMLERMQHTAIPDDMAPGTLVNLGGETPIPLEALPAWVAGRLQELEAELQQASIQMDGMRNMLAERVEMASSSAQDTETTRMLVQDACTAVRDLKDVLAEMDGLSRQCMQDSRTALHQIERIRVRQRQVQLTATRLNQATDAIRSLADESRITFCNMQLDNGTDAEQRHRDTLKALTQLGQQLDEISQFLGMEAAALGAAVRQSLPVAGDGDELHHLLVNSEALREKAALAHTGLLERFARLQEAAFGSGQHALQMLETSSAFVRTATETENLQQRLLMLTEACSLLRQRLLNREPVGVQLLDVPPASVAAPGETADRLFVADPTTRPTTPVSG